MLRSAVASWLFQLSKASKIWFEVPRPRCTTLPLHHFQVILPFAECAAMLAAELHPGAIWRENPS